MSRAWAMVILAMLAMIPSSPAIMFYSQNLFLGPVTDEFGWSQTQFMAPMSAALIAGALLPTFVGAAADRWGVRRVQVPGLILFGAGAMALGLIGNNLLEYWLLAIFVGIASISQTPVFYAKVVASWISERRGLALAVTTSGLALGNILYPPLTAFLIETVGWRWARVGLGAPVLLLALPIAAFFLQERRAPVRRAPVDGAPAEVVAGLGWQAAARTPEFWQISVALVLGSIAINGHLAALVPIVRLKGIDTTTAAFALSLMAICQLAGRLVSGRLLDRICSPRVGALWFAFATAGVFTVQAASEPLGLYAGTALLGLALGAEIELAAYYVTRYFGLLRFGAIYGFMISIYSIASALGPLLMGMAHDLTGTYALAGLVLGGCAGFCTLLLLMLPAYRFALPGGKD